MVVLFLLILGGNLATMITIGTERKKSSYQYLQMSLCCADIILAISGPLVSASVTLMFLTGNLEPGDFLTGNLFHKFQYAEEAVSVGFEKCLPDFIVERDSYPQLGKNNNLMQFTTFSA